MSNRAATTEADQFGAFVRRIIRAYGRRVADRDIEGLAGLVAARADLDDAIGAAVAGLVATGYSWADIGRVLGITRQAAQQQHARRMGSKPTPQTPAGQLTVTEAVAAAIASPPAADALLAPVSQRCELHGWTHKYAACADVPAGGWQ